MEHRISVDRVHACLAGSAPPPAGAEPGVPSAAVAAILRQRDGAAEVLLIRRAARSGDPWSGHMGLPGGHRDPQDATLQDTAARETLEEVGLDLTTDARLLGVLPTIPARAHGRTLQMTVTPFVFELTTDAALSPGGEVAEAIWTPLGPLYRGSRDTTYRLVLDGQTLERPAWDVDGRVVWGLTHQMLSSLFDALMRAPATAPPAGT